MNVGFVGLGVMGAPMARNVLRKGFPLRVFDIDVTKRQGLSADGAVAVAGIADLAAWADAIILMLPGPQEIRAVALCRWRKAPAGARRSWT